MARRPRIAVVGSANIDLTTFTDQFPKPGETIFGQKIATHEPLGSFVFMNEMRPVHRLTNTSNVTYLSRLIELKHITWSVDE